VSLRVTRDGESLLVLEVHPTTEGRNLAQEIWFPRFYDPTRTFLPAIVERFHVVDGEPLCISRMTVRERRRVCKRRRSSHPSNNRVSCEREGSQGLNIGAITQTTELAVKPGSFALERGRSTEKTFMVTFPLA